MSTNADDELLALRSSLEAVDAELVRLLGERQALAAKIGAVKRRAALPIMDPEREAAVVRRVVELGRSAGVPEGLVRDLFWRLLAGAREAQGGGDDQPPALVTPGVPESSPE